MHYWAVRLRDIHKNKKIDVGENYRALRPQNSCVLLSSEANAITSINCVRSTIIETYSLWLEGFRKAVVGFTEVAVEALKTLN